jgi:hypothetical protein
VGRRTIEFGCVFGGFLLFCVLLCRGGTSLEGEQVFPLEEVSVFSLPQEGGYEFLLGQRVVCGEKPDPNVTAYPKFRSDRPLYGKVSLTDSHSKPDPGATYYFALDEPASTGRQYDRLYFDLNGDRDLTNDRAVEVQGSPPPGATLAYQGVAQQVCFQNLAVPFPFGAQGERSLEMIPRLIVSEDGYKTLSFVTTRAHKGRIKVAGKEYEPILGHKYVIDGWFDAPRTGLHLLPPENRSSYTWWGGDRLSAIHKINGAFYRFSATPAGDKLMVRPYDGPLGTFRIGAGGRQIDKLEANGSLWSLKVGVPVGEIAEQGWPKPARECRLPVGDYTANLMTVNFGKLRVEISNNYHADGKPRGATNQPPVCGIAIRENTPFVLDFSNKPAVLFASPARNQRVKLGEELMVKAVLIDPVLDIMIRGLDDPSRKHKKAGSDRTDTSLDPNVVITRANGQLVAEGVMPFG